MNNQEQPSLQVYGNYADKYNSKNPIENYLVKNFIQNFESNLYSLTNKSIASICEIGCAEGELIKRIHAIFPKARLYASDISKEEIAKAKRNCAPISVEFMIQNAEYLDAYKDSSFDVVVCCEVLEHLSNPLKGLGELIRISNKYILVSVPNEPIWRILNIARKKYVKSIGNTPGHINHWNMVQFPKFLNSFSGYSIIKRNFPFPWQMVLLEKTNSRAI